MRMECRPAVTWVAIKYEKGMEDEFQDSMLPYVRKTPVLHKVGKYSYIKVDEGHKVWEVYEEDVVIINHENEIYDVITDENFKDNYTCEVDE